MAGNRNIIAFMNGGLGNQAFQYIFIRYVEIKYGVSCVIDDSLFYVDNVPHNGYELGKLFNIKHDMLSSHYDEDTWKKMLSERRGGYSPAQVLKDHGMDLHMVTDLNNIHFSGPVYKLDKLGELIRSGSKDIYLHGYWILPKFFRKYAGIIGKELSFEKAPALEGKNAELLKQIASDKNSVCIHIRRGDMADLGWCAKPDYFMNAIQTVERKVKRANYYLFSDDLDWCNENAAKLGLDGIKDRLTVISGNNGPDAWKDLELMTECRHFVSDRSSFSYLAYCLRNDRRSIIISRLHYSFGKRISYRIKKLIKQ